MNAQRTLAVLAAVLFVGAVGLATVGPEMVTLGTAVAYISDASEAGLHNWLVRIIGVWSWDYVAHPLLIRPAWLPLGSLGLILAGLALSLPAHDATRRSHRRS
ncbi:MAG: hypothetical protein ABSA58_20245 [Acetobacteraceae bacterium]